MKKSICKNERTNVFTKMNVYYYHLGNIPQIVEAYHAGKMPSHLLYGALQLPKQGIHVIFHQAPYNPCRWKQSLRTTWEVLRHAHQFDALYVTQFRGMELIIYLRALGIFRKPILVWHHTPIVKSTNPIRELLARLFYRGMDQIIVFSQHIYDESLKSVKADSKRMHIVPWGADLEYYDRIRKQQAAQLKATATVAASATTNLHATSFISSGIENRDMQTLTTAFNQTDAPLDIYVSEQYNGINYREWFSSLHMEANIHVHFIHHFVHSEMTATVCQHTAIAICCKETNYTVGLTTLVEAWVLGMPVICSDNPQMPVDIESIGCGISPAYSDTNAWITAIRRLQQHPEEAKEMGRKGRKLAESTYNIEVCAAQVAAILKEMIAK